jgi:uncharacterized protein
MHPMANGIEDFLPYVREKAWRERFQTKEFTLTARATERWYHPGGSTLRDDTRPPDGGVPGSNPEFARSDYLDPYEVEWALMLPLQGSAVGAWTDPIAADVFTTASNNYFLEQWASNDARYKLAMTVSPLDPELAAQEIHRLGGDARVVGVFLPLINVLMGNRYYYPIFKAAVAHGLPVIIHPTGSEGCYLGTPAVAGGVPRTFAERRALLPQVGWSSMNSLVFEGVFERFPTLKVVISEYGFSWALPLLWRMDKERTSFRYEVPWLKSSPSEYVLKHVTFTTQPIDEPAKTEELWALMDMMTAEKTLLFSSDYPHWDTDPPQLIIRRMPKHLQEPIAHGNARAVFAERL